jgi:hypothetical protein
VSEGLVKFVGAIIAIAVVVLIAYRIISENPGVFIALGAIVIGGVAAFFGISSLNQKRVEAKLSRDVPEGAPMRVNLTTEQLGSHKHRLHIDVKMSAADWEAVQQAGYGNHMLFEARGVTSLDNHYAVGHLLRVRYVDFPDMQALQSAKGELLDGLHAMRSRIDAQKERKALERAHGPDKESFEI